MNPGEDGAPALALPFRFGKPLPTARLVLRAIVPGDADAIFAYQSLEETCRFLPFTPRDRESVTEKAQLWAEALTLTEVGDIWQLAIARQETPNGLIGDLYFAVKDVDHATCEIGWSLHPDHQGHGYVTEAAAALLELAFTELHAHRVVAQLDPLNHASSAVARRLGMRPEALHLQDYWYKGHWGDTEIQAILAREWAARRAAA